MLENTIIFHAHVSPQRIQSILTFCHVQTAKLHVQFTLLIRA